MKELDIEAFKKYLETSDFVDKYIEKQAKKREKVTSEEYRKWLLEEAFKDGETLFDDAYLYSDSVDIIHKENTECLSWLFSYISELYSNNNLDAEEQGEYFPELVMFFKLENDYFKIATIFGQGSVTFIEKYLEIPKIFVVI